MKDIRVSKIKSVGAVCFKVLLLNALWFSQNVKADLFSFIDVSDTLNYSGQKMGVLTPSPYDQQTTTRLIHQVNASGLIGLGFLSAGATFRVITGTENILSEMGSQTYADRVDYSGLAYGVQAHLHLHYYLDAFAVYYMSYFEKATYRYAEVSGSSEITTQYKNPFELGISINVPVLKRVAVSARLKYVFMPYSNQTHVSNTGVSTELYNFSQSAPQMPRLESFQAGLALRFYL